MHKILRCSFSVVWRPLPGLFKRSFANEALLSDENVLFAAHRPDQDIGKATNIKSFRCEKENPADHSSKDEALFYNISTEVLERIAVDNLHTKGFSRSYRKQCDAFNETCMMIRKPGLELVNYLKATNPESTVNRYLLYGDTGCGKTMTMQYALNYCISRNWLIVPSYYSWDWIKYQHPFHEHRKQELVVSQYNKDRVDQPEQSTRWLAIFRVMNHPLLDKIYTTKTYVWSKHESSEKGISLSSLVDHGIARPRNAADVIGCIMREVRMQDHTTRPPALVMVDCVNALFWTTLLKIQIGAVYLKPDELSYIYNLKKLLSNTWKNGAVVTAVNAMLIPFILPKVEALKDIDDEHPYDMIGGEGFDLLDPHIPIHVPLFSEKEIMNYLAYFIDRKWLVGRSLTQAGQDEIIQVTCHNPREFVNYCGGSY